jgi:hypothetical protein
MHNFDGSGEVDAVISERSRDLWPKDGGKEEME